MTLAAEKRIRDVVVRLGHQVQRRQGVVVRCARPWSARSPAGSTVVRHVGVEGRGLVGLDVAHAEVAAHRHAPPTSWSKLAWHVAGLVLLLHRAVLAAHAGRGAGQGRAAGVAVDVVGGWRRRRCSGVGSSRWACGLGGFMLPRPQNCSVRRSDGRSPTEWPGNWPRPGRGGEDLATEVVLLPVGAGRHRRSASLNAYFPFSWAVLYLLSVSSSGRRRISGPVGPVPPGWSRRSGRSTTGVGIGDVEAVVDGRQVLALGPDVDRVAVDC